MRRTLTAIAATAALTLVGLPATAAAPAPAADSLATDSRADVVPGVPDASASADAWHAWAAALAADAHTRADDPSPGCTIVDTQVELVVDAAANAQLGAPADLAMPVVRTVEDCGKSAAAAAAPARGVASGPEAAPQARLGSGSRCGYVTGGRLCLSDSGSTIRGTFTASTSTRGFVRLYQISPWSSGCPTGSTRATSSERSLRAGQTLSTWFYQTQNSGYNATFWRDVAWGHSKAGSVCAIL